MLNHKDQSRLMTAGRGAAPEVSAELIQEQLERPSSFSLPSYPTVAFTASLSSVNKCFASGLPPPEAPLPTFDKIPPQ